MSELGTQDNPISPDKRDHKYWYKIQSNGKWYLIWACCRRCATEKLHEHIYTENKRLDVVAI